MKVKKCLFLSLLFCLFIPFVHAEETVNLYLFHGDGCPHCAAEREFLDEIKDNYENLDIHLYEVWYDEENQELMQKVKDALNIEQNGVPLTVIDSDYYIGYNTDTGMKIEDKIKNYSPGENVVENILSDSDYYKNNKIIEKKETKENKDATKDTFNVPILGKIDGKSVSLPILAIVIGFVDGFNPCAMWVLLLLISMLMGMKDRKRMWILGLAFLGTSAFIYLLFMMSWLQVTAKVSQIILVRNIIALVALTAGIINLMKYAKESKKDEGCDIVDDKKRKRFIKKIKKFTTENSLILALIGVMTLAISVNVVELLCSAGLPLIFTQILAMNDLSSGKYFAYILLYIFFFLIDDLIVFFVAMKSFKLKGFSKKYGNLSHLIGGIIMVIIGVLLLIKPEWIMFNF